MSLTDILFLGWLINFGWMILMMGIVFIIITLTFTMGTPENLLNMNNVLKRNKYLLDSLSPEIKQKRQIEGFITLLLPYSGLMELFVFIYDMHCAGYSFVHFVENDSNKLIEKYELKDVL